MKNNLPINDHESDYAPDIHIVSSTDNKGIIRSCNSDFIEISGFSEEELLGKNHNIVRHPDMPEAAFADLWGNLKQKRSWTGIVKNRSKNGDYYWVDAYITPIVEDSEVIGYQSVRVKPDRLFVERAEALYKQLNKGVSFFQGLKSKLQFGLMGKIYTGFLIALTPLIILITQSGSMLALGALLTTALVGLVFAKLIAKPWQQAAKESAQLFSNVVAQHVFTGRSDELGQLQLVIHAQESSLKTVVWSIDDAASKLDDISQSTAHVVDQTNTGIIQQQSKIEQVATAMNEMTSTVHEVATNAGDASTATNEARDLAHNGALIATRSITSIMSMVSDAEEAANVIGNLASQTDSIGSVLDVIRGIAEQTNLLALNAAIEAARAGEQGRGFAVVADEVRTLASRTHESTQEIQEMIESLQIEAKKAVDVMLKAQNSAETNMDATENMAENLAEISGAVQTISAMNSQIATTAEEQSAVSEEINRNIVNISEVSEQTRSTSAETAEESSHLLQESERLRVMVRQLCTKQ